MILLSLILSAVGFAHLAMSVKRHYQECFNCPPNSLQRQCFKLLGWLCLTLSLWPCLLVWPFGIGVTAWLGLLTASSLMIMTSLSYAKESFRRCWRFCCAGGWLTPLLVQRH